MKMLSVHQPWASLILHGLKRLLVCPRNTPHRGLLLVHAAGRWTRPMADACRPEAVQKALASIGAPFPGFYGKSVEELWPGPARKRKETP